MSNESEQFDAIHAFVCASVAACFATIYPRANPEKFRELVARVNRPEVAARAPECEARTATQCLAREQAELDALRAIVALDDELAARLRAFLKDCGCPCCSARARLRTLSYERACESPASIHCASTDGRDHLKDPGPCPEITRADLDAEKAIQSALEAARVAAHSCPR